MANGNEKVWVADLIKNDYKEWYGKKILIGCGTGRGKTMFALGTYCKWLLSQKKRILYICNRTKLKEQIKTDIIAYGVTDVDIISYQKLKERIEKNNIKKYDVYICDEAHYFLSDAEFNIYTDIPYEYILRQNNATVIYMTATYWNIQAKLKTDLKEELKEYFLPTDYSYVNKICWYQKPHDLFGIIDRILNETDDKIIYFCNSSEKMKELYNHYDPSDGKNTNNEELLAQSKLQYIDFICSKYNGNLWMKKHCSDKNIRKSEKGGYSFNNRVLVATKSIDNGIDFKDRKIKHIICDIFDIESALQCLGRKRSLDENDTCIFYIRDWKHYQLNIFHSRTVEELKMPQLFLADREKWKKIYSSDRESKDKTVYYDFRINDFNINPLRYDKLISDEKLINKMLNQKTSFREIISSRLGSDTLKKSKDLKDIEADIVKSDIDIWLENHKNKILTKEEKDELVQLCNIRDKWNRQQKSIKIINAYIEENYVGYSIISKVSKMNGKAVRNWVLKMKNETVLK